MPKKDLLFELLTKPGETRKESLWEKLAGGLAKLGRSESAERASAEMKTPALTEADQAVDQFGLSRSGDTQSGSPASAFAIAVAIVILGITFFCGYTLGRSQGWKRGLESRSDRQLADIQRQAPQPDVLEPGVIGGPIGMAAGSADEGPAAGVPEPAAGGDVRLQTERQQGLNYLIIQTFRKQQYDSAKRAGAFLAERGIEVTIEESNGLLMLVSTVGFENPKTDNNAQLFRSQIESLGRVYKTMLGSDGVDFRGCWYQKW